MTAVTRAGVYQGVPSAQYIERLLSLIGIADVLAGQGEISAAVLDFYDVLDFGELDHRIHSDVDIGLAHIVVQQHGQLGG